MIRNAIAAAALVVALGSAIAPAQAAIQDVDLMNSSGWTIFKTHLSPAHRENWGRDILGDEVLGDGEVFERRFNRDQPTCDYDVKVVFRNGKTITEYGVDLCSVATLEIFRDGIDAY